METYVHLIVVSVLGVSMISLISFWVGMSRYTNQLKKALKNEKNNIECIRKEIKENDRTIEEVLKNFASKNPASKEQMLRELKIS
ncbi:MAG: hypothetical protein NUV74_02725 [Candidatus Brocadiaceae bacterium]|nr:hypothetical protein [Candidatus Brocadiaceae bacterium]